ncbi:nitrite/sulfite reductase [Amphritea japonica]|uniref:Sulfite reductase (NADPH) hemoprotein beta-component n=1 Tax=Amphritea japonica ATCC BAA-1530 TaxID=1278309 RepID=A0A7R6PA23_9GAMM|nr:nitrite/sulfite reductase [Amphritea japonica]BBB25341.1 sulfite reductase (NADPH) hemoprotein beta-component [Amphritea japonica ATCC BAA-1530]
MYQYDEVDYQVVRGRVSQFKNQIERYQSGLISEEAFLPLRLQNGLYIQKHAPMLRVAVPYGMLSSIQLRMLARICREFDRDYCHITTRQNIQFNWVELADVPEILDRLASVEMHAIQTSGNCIRNTTSDPLAGVVHGEVSDPRPYCEIIRQWSTLHPEFAYLPRKFKIAVIGAEEDRASIRLHDIGLQLIKSDAGDIGFKVWAGGGLGRTPMLGRLIRAFLPQEQLLGFLKAIIRVYNRYGRRDNKYKARIKILVANLGVEEFSRQVEQEFDRNEGVDRLLTQEEISYAQSFFTAPDYESATEVTDKSRIIDADLYSEYARWLERNVRSHKIEGYRIVTLSLKYQGTAPGDISTQQLEQLADLAEQYSFAEIRTTQQQNIILTDVKSTDLYSLWLALRQLKLDTPTVGTLSDTVCCPGADFCNLANARSLTVNAAIQQRFNDLNQLYELGDLSLRISGCINACAHHHIANIGILGVDKNGQEYYQITLGGMSGKVNAIGKVLGPSLPMEKVVPAIGKIIGVYIANRSTPSESFSAVYLRIGKSLFKESVYAANN